MLKFLLLVTLPLTVIEAISFTNLVAEEFELFKVEHGKKYENPVEEKFRMKIFMENKHKIASHNKRFENGEVTYKVAMNHFGDMLHHEFVKTMNGFKKPSHSSLRFSGGLFDSKAQNNETNAVTYIEPFGVELPKSFDWRKNGAVTPVKNQGQCGSCWAFSATGSLEGQHFRKTGQLVSLSEQNLVDCSRKEGNNGCNGGLMDQAFEYVKENHGIDTEDAYPYNADEEKCKYNPKKSGATDKGYVDIPEGDEKKLMSAVATIGPISIAIDASHETFQFYSSGVYYDKGCSSTDLDHGVLCVGYGTDSVTGQDYWLVKNSWGEKWGSDGYIKMARNKRNACGVASSASYPLV